MIITKVRNKLNLSLTLAVLLAMILTSLALADQIANNLDVSVDANFETMTLNVGGSDGLTTLRIVEQNGDGKNGCNLTGSGSELTVSVVSSNPSVASVSPASVTFNACGDTRTITVKPVSQGSADITLGLVSFTTSAPGVTSSSFDMLPGRFTVSVSPPPNTAPIVSVMGVTHGANYEFGSVPAAGCFVQDVEDGNPAVDPSLSTLSGPLAAYGLGTQTANCSYTDTGGLTTTVEATYEIVDTTAPVITFVDQTPAANVNGWNNTDVTVNWSCSDNVGVVSSSISQAVSGEGDNLSAFGTCTDLVGLTASATVTGINIDKTAPAITFDSQIPAANENGWNSDDVTVTWSCTDSGSGVAAASVSQTVSTEGSGQSATGTCDDLAGNTASDTQSGINIDKTAPTGVALSVTAGTAGTNGWYTSDVTIHTSSDPDISGGTCTPDQTQTSETPGAIFNGTCTNGAGLSADATPLAVKLDKTGPSASLAVTAGTLGSNGWYTSDVTVSTTGSDLISAPVTCTADQLQSAETSGEVFNGSCTNDAGLTTAAEPLTVKLDKTGPSASLSISGNLGTNNWYINDVTASTTGSDTVSNPTTCSADQFLTSDTASYTFSGSCTNDAGLTTQAATQTVQRDATPPIVSLVGGPANNTSYYFGFVPTAPTCSASDALSGLAGACSVSGYSGAVGAHTVAATATDLAGNTSTASASYTVSAWTLKGFYQPVDMNGVYNTVKNGSTVPFKFEIFAGSTELTDTSIITFSANKITCSSGSVEDAIEVTATGGTSLRYDATASQFVYNWKTPASAGQCYQVTMKTLDGSSLVAYFKLK